MKIHYWPSDHGNFGDDLNLFLWPHFLPGLIDDDPDTLLVGVGTVLNDEIPPARRRIVMGSGIGYGRLPDDLDDPAWDIRAVRGPLSARVLGRPDLAAVDPAVLLPLMPDFAETGSKTGPVFVPHWTTAGEADWAAICARAGIGYVDPREEAKAVIARIAAADLVIAESMHGAIVADAFRVPWVAVVTGRDTPFKWHDWAQALGLDYAPLELGQLTRPARVAKDRIRGRAARARPGGAGAVTAAYDGYMARYAPAGPAPRPGAAQRIRRALHPAVEGVLGALTPARRVEEHAAARLEAALAHPPSLSEDHRLEAAQADLLARIDRLRSETA